MDKVTLFPIRAKPHPDEVELQLLQSWERTCDHLHKGFVVDESKLEVSCRGCGEKLNPAWALARLAEQESTWRRSRQAYIQERKALEERRRTKCRHCGRITPIRV
jgi:hypothetical protein